MRVRTNAFLAIAVVSALSFSSPRIAAQAPGVPAVYKQIKAFALTGGRADVSALTFKRDRVEMTLTGTLFFSDAVEGKVTGAVFIGQGTMRVEMPPNEFEKDNVRRLLGAEIVDSDFKTAVFRMTDDTADVIGKARAAGAATPAAEKLAADFEPRLMKETGINLSARLAGSILNAETPGVFFAEFDGGRRGHFDVVLDQQSRIPTSSFYVDGGEKGMVFSYQAEVYGTDTWLAFYSQSDYDKGKVIGSDASNLVDITSYKVDIGLRDPGAGMGVVSHIEMKTLAPNVRAIPFKVGEGLPTYQDSRLKQQMRLVSAHMGKEEIAAVQEDWEGGFTVYLPAAVPAGQTIALDVEMQGKFLRGDVIPECFYLVSNESWLPRHGILDRATFELTYHHLKRHVVASVGERISEGPDDNKDFVVTKYKLDQPVALVSFALGPFRRSKKTVTWEAGGTPTPLEFNGVQRNIATVNDQFILDEMDNAVRYFASMFGRYPYPVFGAALHPYGFGQGFPTMLMLPPADRQTTATFAFLAHETAHQWWGNIVAWRSYRDQWLSEGFAEYSGMLYAGLREKPESTMDLIKLGREELRVAPRTARGVGKGRLADIGPIILGLRLNTSKSFGAYQALIYQKGALVLRMLHFLLTNPATADDSAFRTMMTAFVEKYRNGSASTEDFFQIAGEHFARSPIGQKYSLANLDWFYKQWVLQSALPSYTLEYSFEDQPGGAVVVNGTIKQEGVPETWTMPVPVVFSFPGNQIARTTVRAQGASATFQIKLPAKPTKVELDPAMWVLSDKTTVRAK